MEIVNSNELTEIPKEIYGNQSVKIGVKMSNGGAGPTGILKKLSEEYLSTLDNPNFSIAWYQNISKYSLQLVIENKIDFSLVYEKFEIEKALKDGLISYSKLLFNDHFILVGPKNNDCLVEKSDSIQDAFRKIYLKGETLEVNKCLFFSRDDLSATNVKERSIWDEIDNIPYEKKWYKKYNCFPVDGLLLADKEEMFTITDRGTYIMNLKKLNNTIIYASGGDNLLNPCFAIWKDNISENGKHFLNYLMSESGQNIISKYGLIEYGDYLYTPALIKDFDI